MAIFSQRSQNSLSGIHPDLVRLMNEAIIDTPIDFTVTDGVRTTAQQQSLYAQGRTTPGPRVTNADGVRNKSNHQPHADGFGHAVDLYPYINGKVDVNNDRALQVIAGHIKAVAARMGIPIEWGGDWKSITDYPHFELAK